MPTPEPGAWRVAHLTTVHARYDTRIFHKQCTSLAAAGYEVFLLVADGRGDETMQGVHIRDIGAAGGRFRRILFQPWRMWRAARRLGARLYHMHDPELLPIGVLLVGDKTDVVYDSHEDLPRQILTKHWIAKPLRTFVSACAEFAENFFVRRLSGVIAATPAIRNRFEKVNARVIEVCNYPTLSDVAVEAPKTARRSRVICYIGGVTESRGVMQMLDALRLLTDVRMVICGVMESPALYKRMLEHEVWQRVEYRGQVDRRGVRAALDESALGLVTLLPFPSYKEALPVKMFEYMAAGLPVVASDFPMWREIVDQAACGVCVDPTEPAQIARAIREVMDDPQRADAMSAAGRRAVAQLYNWDRQVINLTAMYQKLIGGNA